QAVICGTENRHPGHGLGGLVAAVLVHRHDVGGRVFGGGVEAPGAKAAHGLQAPGGEAAVLGQGEGGAGGGVGVEVHGEDAEHPEGVAGGIHERPARADFLHAKKAAGLGQGDRAEAAVLVERERSGGGGRGGASGAGRGGRDGRAGREAADEGGGAAEQRLQAAAVIEREADAAADADAGGERSAGAQERAGEGELAGGRIVLGLAEQDFASHGAGGACGAGLNQEPERGRGRDREGSAAQAGERDGGAGAGGEGVAAGKLEAAGAVAAALKPAEIRLAIVKGGGDLLPSAAAEMELVVGAAEDQRCLRAKGSRQDKQHEHETKMTSNDSRSSENPERETTDCMGIFRPGWRTGRNLSWRTAWHGQLFAGLRPGPPVGGRPSPPVSVGRGWPKVGKNVLELSGGTTLVP